MGLHTPLYKLHAALNAEMVDFDGQDMPLHYGSRVEEHHQVQRDCSVFDVSHMTVVDVSGRQATAHLQHLLTNDVTRLGETDKVLCSATLNGEGGVVGDLVIYLTESGYWVVVNASTRDKDIIWMQAQVTGFKVDLQERGGLAMLAIRGSSTHVHSSELVSPTHAAPVRELKPFQGRAKGNWFIARTGYTDEGGLEVILPATEAPGFLNELVGAGVSPTSLEARNTPRLEVGLNLYGQDMNESVSLPATNMGWTVAWEPVTQDFAGRHALEAQKATGDQPRLVGLALEEYSVLRAHRVVRVVGIGEGKITSGSFSSTLSKSIALACVSAAIGDRAEVKIRDKWYLVRAVQPSSVRHGKPLV